MATFIPIDSGTGPNVAVDNVGTNNYQVMKLMAVVSGSTGVFWTGAVTVSNTPSVTVSTGTIAVSSLPAISGSVSILNTPTITVSTGTVSIAVLPAIAGSVSIINTPTITVSTGTVTIAGNIATISNVLTVGTLLGTVAVSGGGGGAQYTVNSTNMAATATGSIILGIQSGATTARGMAISTTGGLIIASMPALGGGQQYDHASTSIAATGTGTLIIGVQSGATTARRLVLSTSGQILAVVTGTLTALPSGTQSVTVVNVLSATGVVVASITTGTVTNIPTAYTTFTGGRLVVAADNVATTAASIAVRQVHINALPGNTSTVVVGGAAVTAAATSVNGIILQPLQGITLHVDDINKIFIISNSSGNGIAYAYLN